MHQQKFSDALANFNPLRSPTAQPLHSPPAQPLHSVERNLCTAASATFALPTVLPLRYRERIYAGWRHHWGLPDASYGPAEKWRAMQNAAGNPIWKKVPAFSALPKFIFS